MRGPRWSNVLIALGLAGFFGVVSFTAPRWARLLSRTAPVAPEEEPPPAAAAAPSPEATAAAKTISVKLFFEEPEHDGLVMEERTVGLSPDLGQQIRAVVEELVKGSQAGNLPPLPPETRVLDVFVTGRGVAYVDLSKEAAQGTTGGTSAELRTVYAVVNTITVNFPAIRRVQILVDDRPAPTLAGHVDLSRPLPPDMTLLAATDLKPVATGNP